MKSFWKYSKQIQIECIIAMTAWLWNVFEFVNPFMNRGHYTEQLLKSHFLCLHGLHINHCNTSLSSYTPYTLKQNNSNLLFHACNSCMKGLIKMTVTCVLICLILGNIRNSSTYRRYPLCIQNTQMSGLQITAIIFECLMPCVLFLCWVVVLPNLTVFEKVTGLSISSLENCWRWSFFYIDGFIRCTRLSQS